MSSNAQLYSWLKTTSSLAIMLLCIQYIFRPRRPDSRLFDNKFPKKKKKSHEYCIISVFQKKNPLRLAALVVGVHFLARGTSLLKKNW
jgi:hypothetical protein